jgi:HEAT repeat protein
MGFFRKDDVDNMARRGDLRGLLNALRGRDPVVQARASLLLGSIGRPAVPVLIEGLKDEDKDVRTAAAAALISIGPEARFAVGTLVRALKDEDYFVRWNSAVALGEIGDKEAVPALMETLADENIDVRKAAADALEKIEWEKWYPGTEKVV